MVLAASGSMDIGKARLCCRSAKQSVIGEGGRMRRFIRLRVRYWKHELKHYVAGDKRCNFEKLVDRCRLLELNKVIHNAY